MIATLRTLRAGIVLLPVALATACSDGGTAGPPAPSSIQANVTLPGTAPVATILSPSVRITDSGGRPVAGAVVTFEVSAGGGSVAVSSAPSDASGIASPGAWTLGTTAGANTLVARLGSLTPVAFVVNATAGAAAAMAPAPGNAPSATAGLAVPVPPGVRVTDAFGNGVAGVPITFSATAGSGTVAGPTQTTAADGIARPAAWTLGQTAGTQTLNAVAGPLSAVVSVDALPGPPSNLVRLSVATQTAGVSSPVADPPSIRAEDQFGNIVAGVVITFAAVSGGGSVSGGTQTTDAAGIATVGAWTLGPTPGPNTLTASATGAGTTSFSATALDPSGLLVEKLAGDGTTCPINIDGCVFSVRVTQAGGQPVAGETVIWSNGMGTTVNTVTNSRGIATQKNIPPNSAIGGRTQTATLQTTGQQVSFGYSLVAGGGFNIDIRYVGPTPSAAVQAAFNDARTRWQSVITGDLPNVFMNVNAGACGISHPALNETVDDLLVLVVVDSIDGVGGTLGSAGPCYIRTTGSLPIIGVMRLDSADLAALATTNRLRDVVLHELGHTLGFPALWSDTYFALLKDTATSNPYYSGAQAGSRYEVAGGTFVNVAGVPVENTGGSATRHGHWRESVFATELMTGFISGPGTPNPLSAITIGSLLDIGYQVNFGVADPYLLPGVSPGFGGGTVLELRELPLPPPKVVR